MTTSIYSKNATQSAIQVNGVDALVVGATGIISGGAAGFRNKLTNGSFVINQRAVAGTVTLAAGVYGHDRWKAGAGGCTYTFASSANGMMLTITAGTLVQVIDGANFEGGAFKLSWAGTSTGRVDTGAYGASGVVATTVPYSNQSIEFTTGTLARVQYEFGSIATAFESRFLALEFVLCQRFFQTFTINNYRRYCSNTDRQPVLYPVVMRAPPTIVTSGVTGIGYQAFSLLGINDRGGYFEAQFTSGGIGVVDIGSATFTLSAEL